MKVRYRRNKIQEIKDADDRYKEYLIEHIKGIRDVYHNKIKDVLVSEGISKITLDKIEDLITHHDESKFGDGEWIPYRDHFYRPDENPRSGDKYNQAWNQHQKNNPHHWQYWCLINDVDDPQVQPLDIPLEYVIEMICDWASAGKQYGNTAGEWYNQQRDRMILTDNSRALIEKYLAYLD